MPPRAYVHLVAADRAALTEVLDRADDTFMEFGVAPDRRTTALDLATARRCADAAPTADGDWLPYLSTELVDAVAEDLDGARLHHAGITGMAVVDRLLREETPGHPDVYLQSDDRSAGVSVGYTVYRYAGSGRGYERLADRDGLGV